MGTDVTQCWRQNPLQLLSRDLVGGRGRERNCGCSIVVPFGSNRELPQRPVAEGAPAKRTSRRGARIRYNVEFKDIPQPSTILIQNTPLRRPESWLLRSSGPGRTAPPRLARASLQYRPAANPDRHLLASWTAMAWGGFVSSRAHVPATRGSTNFSPILNSVSPFLCKFFFRHSAYSTFGLSLPRRRGKLCCTLADMGRTVP